MGSSASKAARSAGKSFPSSTKQAAARLGLGEGHAQQQQQRVASLREEQPPPMFHGEKDEALSATYRLGQKLQQVGPVDSTPYFSPHERRNENDPILLLLRRRHELETAAQAEEALPSSPRRFPNIFTLEEALEMRKQGASDAQIAGEFAIHPDTLALIDARYVSTPTVASEVDGVKNVVWKSRPAD